MFGSIAPGGAIPAVVAPVVLPPGTPMPARNALVGNAETAIVECGTPVLAGFLAAQSGRPQPDVLRLPELRSQHGLYALLNDALGHIAAMAERQRQALQPASIADVLGVLAHVHADTYAKAITFVRARGCVLPEWTLSVARRQFENQVRRDLRTGAGYRLARNGTPDPQNADNVAVFLRLIGAELQFNDWKQRSEIRWRDGEWALFTDMELNRLRAIASQEEHSFRPSKEFFKDMLSDLARQNVVDPVLDYIDSIKWDGVCRLNIWLSATCGVPCDLYHQYAGRNLIGGMVKRARKPGSKHDEVLVLLGEEGQGKSAVFKILAHKREWFTDSILFDQSPQNLFPQFAGKWVAELSELDAMATREISAIKRFFRQESDDFTAKYAAHAEDRPRRIVFAGTSNDDAPLRSATGNRCFLPVRVNQPINLDWLRQNVDQLIAEAAALEARGETFAIPPEVWAPAKVRQEDARAVSAVETQLEAWFASWGDDVFITKESLEYGLTAAKFNPNDKLIPIVLRKLRFERDRVSFEKEKISIWVRTQNKKWHPGCTRLAVYQRIGGGPVKMELWKATI
jgi:predicted P-loop ATPase